MSQSRIIKALSGFYYVEDGDKIIQCRARGKFRKDEIKPLVGDYVEYAIENRLEQHTHEHRSECGDAEEGGHK